MCKFPREKVHFLQRMTCPVLLRRTLILGMRSWALEWHRSIANCLRRDRVNNSDEIRMQQTCTPETWMEEALRQAQRAFALGEVPVGAVVVREGQVVGRGWNCPISSNDPTAHAEILALREAGRAVGNYRLSDCDLYVTIEPCAMCAGAITHARIRRLVYGADDPKAGAVHSVMQVLNHPQLNHRVEVTSGVLAARASDTVQAFFRERRTK